MLDVGLVQIAILALQQEEERALKQNKSSNDRQRRSNMKAYLHFVHDRRDAAAGMFQRMFPTWCWHAMLRSIHMTINNMVFAVVVVWEGVLVLGLGKVWVVRIV
jgi:hypothetical protein